MSKDIMGNIKLQTELYMVAREVMKTSALEYAIQRFVAWSAKGQEDKSIEVDSDGCKLIADGLRKIMEGKKGEEIFSRCFGAAYARWQEVFVKNEGLNDTSFKVPSI